MGSPVRVRRRGRGGSGALAAGHGQLRAAVHHLRHPPLPAGPLVGGDHDVGEQLLPPRPRRVSFLQQPADLPLLSLLIVARELIADTPSDRVLA